MGWLSKLAGGIGAEDSAVNDMFGGLFGEGPDIKGIVKQERESDRAFGESARASLTQGIEARRAGFDQATGAASDASRALRRRTIQQGNKAQSELMQRYGAGGRFATTALDNARLGVASALTQDLEQIDAGFASLLGELAIGKGAAEAEGQGLLANLDMNRSEQESELYRLLLGHEQNKPGAAQWLSLIGAGAGAMAGGPAGAAFGGEAGNILGGQMDH